MNRVIKVIMIIIMLVVILMMLKINNETVARINTVRATNQELYQRLEVLKSNIDALEVKMSAATDELNDHLKYDPQILGYIVENYEAISEIRIYKLSESEGE